MRVIAGLVAVAAVAAAGAGLAGAVSSRDALIRPGVGIGKVRLGMTFGEVRRALGRPSAVLKRKDFGFGSAYVEYQWRGGEWNVGVLGRPGRQSVVMVSTNLRAQRTRSGVGVASTERAVGRRLGARCTRHIIEGGWMFDGLCYTGRRGGVQTVFRLGGTCLLPARTYYVCPSARRRYTVYEVVVANASGLSLTGISIP